ncbi:uncharacterized protein LOC125827319 [Solanum verrucosum]|uniref:uncharacterized protein LOC125827319 n=1 Tax=Solanum verrucosum TaxID=315347 RepID=UPI0020D1BFB2|nr:uncharacterized protein LOC125827319 [Solanum verrucosum]
MVNWVQEIAFSGFAACCCRPLLLLAVAARCSATGGSPTSADHFILSYIRDSTIDGNLYYNTNQGGGETFSTIGFKSWNKKGGLDKHIGLPNSIHNRSKNKCQDLLRQQQSIQFAFERQSNQLKHGYLMPLIASVDVVRLLISRGFAFRGHDESKSSLSRDKILSWHAKKYDKIRNYVLEHAPSNDQMTSPMIQKDIVSACKIETVKAILEELNGDYFALLVDESFDVSHKEQMAIVFRYIDRKGFVMERLIDIVRVQDTSAPSLKEAIFNLLAQHSLSPSSVRGQCYDGTSNMQVFCNIIDWQLQELNDRFDEVTTDLLHGIACLNPINSFSSFDLRKVMRMAELYPDDFDESNMSILENQLASYIIDVHDVDERFSDLNGLCNLSKRLVKTKKHSNYPLVFRLVKLALLLPVVTASVERAFSAMKFIKNDLRSQMSDDFFSGCLVPYLEKDVFDNISNDVIIKTFQDMKPRRIQL